MLWGHLRVGAKEESYRTAFITLCHWAALRLCGDAKGSSLCVVRRDVFVQLVLLYFIFSYLKVQSQLMSGNLARIRSGTMECYVKAVRMFSHCEAEAVDVNVWWKHILLWALVVSCFHQPGKTSFFTHLHWLVSQQTCKNPVRWIMTKLKPWH